MFSLCRAWFTRLLFLGVLTALAAPAVAAQPSALSCGIYATEDGSQIHLFTSDLMFKTVGSGPPTLMRYAVVDSTFAYVDLDLNGADSLQIEQGTLVDRMWRKVYVLDKSVACSQAGLPAPKTAAGQACWNDLVACKDVPYSASLAELHDLCRDYLPFVCRFMVVKYSAEAVDAATAVSDLPPALPQAALDSLVASCRGGLSAAVCQSASEALWASGQYLQARHTTQYACDAPFRDAQACQYAKGMAGLTEEALSTPVPGIPVGFFKADTGINPKLSFDEDGNVTMGFARPTPAREEDGLIRMRHNKGGDFVVRRVGEDTLIGVDTWNQLVVYARRESGF